MRVALWAAALAVAAVGGGLATLLLTHDTAPSRETFRETLVESVVDGDTVILSTGERLRYLGLDTPEAFGEPECGAEEATEFNRDLVEGRSVELLSGPEEHDRYGRLLAYVFADGVFVNAELVREGMARAQSFHPEERFAQVLVQLEMSARETGRGHWARCGWE